MRGYITPEPLPPARFFEMDGGIPIVFLFASYWMWGRKVFLAQNIGLTKIDRARVRKAKARKKSLVLDWGTQEQ